MVISGADNSNGGDDGSLENETYLYDALNDLTYRAQRKPDGSLLQESFGYDALTG